MIWMKNDDLKNLINAEIKTGKKKNIFKKIKSRSNTELYCWLVIVAAAAAAVTSSSDHPGSVLSSLTFHPALSENIWGCEVMRTQLS